MKLTNQQTQEVERYITQKKVDYLDLKLEILDHMISEIEEKMNKNSSFEDAFYIVKQKWNKHFVQRTSFYFGNLNPAPKIVIETAKKIYKPYYFIMFSMYFFPLILLYKYNILVDENLQFYLNIFFKTTGGISILLLIYSYYKSKQLKNKSIYSFISKAPYPSIFIGVIVLFTNYFSKNDTFKPISIGMWFVFMFVSGVSYFFYMKHASIIKKLQGETN